MPRAFSTVIDGRQPQRLRDVTTAGSGQTPGSTVLRNFSESFQLFVAVVLAAHVSDTHNTLTEWDTRLYLHSVGRPDRFVFGIEDADSVVQACDLEDVPVVVAEAVGEEPLLLAVDADEQRDQEPYAATVHVLEALEVQYDGARLSVTSLVVGVHQNVLGECRELSLDVYDTHLLADLPDVHVCLCLGHAGPPRSPYLPYPL